MKHDEEKYKIIVRFEFGTLAEVAKLQRKLKIFRKNVISTVSGGIHKTQWEHKREDRLIKFMLYLPEGKDFTSQQLYNYFRRGDQKSIYSEICYKTFTRDLTILSLQNKIRLTPINNLREMKGKTTLISRC